ncbi:MAG: ATP-grasp domain-containing protein [Acidobacteria bacterium]|nr:ATP-grasp domain-containing protein [Acidobacteriota bacterium]
MDGLKICILYELNEDEAPSVEPERAARNGNGRRPRRRKPVHDRDEIFEALTRLGHQPFYHALDGRPATLTAVAKCDADLIFNLVESYGGNDTRDMNVAAYLDLLGIPYTGAGPHALYLAQDKSLAKKIFAFHAIQTPFFATSYRGRLDHAHDISFPLIVKPASEDGSIGIDAGAVVSSVKELMERIHYVHEQFNSPALVEEYIEGREIYAAVWGSCESAEVLPLIELDLSKLSKDAPRIACRDVKFNKETEAYKLTKSAPAEDLDEETTAQIRETALAAYNALKLRDYGRIDIRLKEDGQVYVIEANPNPWLSAQAEFAMAAKASGINYAEMIARIVGLAMARESTEIRAVALARG